MSITYKASVDPETRKTVNGPGFSIHDEAHLFSITLAYPDDLTAEVARQAIHKALANAISCVSRVGS